MKPGLSFFRYGRRAGAAIVEFALVAPLLLLLTAGVLDYAMLLRTAASLADAARVGAQYGSVSVANSANISGMQTAAVNSAPGISGMTATAVQTCECPGGAAVSCSGSCTGGKMLVYVKVTTQATADTVFSYSQLPFSGTVKGQASMRAQ
ncbi:putative TadE family protein [Candidatus Sulfopaludibacter sp. SbA6]|nr:putative TadE family protein [Candidatus Sulfopaludibacter sp. SbA6]